MKGFCPAGIPQNRCVGPVVITLLRRRGLLNLLTLVVERSLLDCKPLETRPERRSTLVAKELKKYNMDVIALPKQDFLVKSTTLNLLVVTLFTGVEKSRVARKKLVLVLPLKLSLVDRLNKLSCDVSNGLDSMRFTFIKNWDMTIISVYAPTMYAGEDEKLGEP